MTKTTHTNRGTCQACGKVQAVDNTSGLIAKHGYKVLYGEFHFTCNAANYKPAEHDLTYTHVTIIHCNEMALRNDEAIPPLQTGTVVPATFERWNPEKVKRTPRRNGNGYFETKGDYDTLPIAQATPDELAKRVAMQIRYHEGEAIGYRAHVQFLRTRVIPRLGQELYPNEELAKPRYAAGFTFKHEGHDYIITRPAYSTFGDKHVGWHVRRVGDDGRREMRWSTRSLNDAVNPKPTKVPGGYDTKAARKADLDKLNRMYDKLKRAVRDAFNAVPLGHAERTEAQNAAYFAIPHDLCHWRAKHGVAIVELFPVMKDTVDAINALVVEREKVKAAPGA